MNHNLRVVVAAFLIATLLPELAIARTETYVIGFNESDFEFSYNENKELEIVAPMASYMYDEDVPGLPLFSTNIAVKGGSSYVSSSLNFTKRLILQNVKLAQAPIAIPTDSIVISQLQQKATYAPAVYPSSNCEYASASNWSDVSVLHFLSCPFVYDDFENKLYFIDSIEVSINLDDVPQMPKALGAQRRGADLDIVKSVVINKSDVDSLSFNHTVSKQASTSEKKERIDYVIITKEYLREEFGALMRWKKTKGLYSKIITIEEIESNYTGADTQVKIKKCLYDLYTNNSLKYALLGGDDFIVPVRECEINDAKFKLPCPVDMYYSCFGGNFEWDADGNGIYGEAISDSVDLAQSICVTRIPVCNRLDVRNYTNKLLEYEKTPKWSNSFLMCGCRLSSIKDSVDEKEWRNEALVKGDRLYNMFVKPYWDGNLFKFYDCYSNVSIDSVYDFKPENLVEQLSRGYDFMTMLSHGSENAWGMSNDTFYNKGHARSQTNVKSTIITTMACWTNAFDLNTIRGNDDYCVSEGFILGANNKVVAYLACSRSGWYYARSVYHGPSLEYESEFYKNLFNKDNCIKEKNFGRIVNAAKASYAGKCSNYNNYRWIQFGLNPLGDPEMPIFIDTPLEFDNVTIQANSSNSIEINTGVAGCRICIMSRNDFGERYYKVFEDVQRVSRTDLPTDCNICITKQGYIPRQITLAILQNEQASTRTSNYKYDYIITGSALTTYKVLGPVEFNGSVTLTGACIQINPSTTISKDCEFKIEIK